MHHCPAANVPPLPSAHAHTHEVGEIAPAGQRHDADVLAALCPQRSLNLVDIQLLADSRLNLASGCDGLGRDWTQGAGNVQRLEGS